MRFLLSRKRDNKNRIKSLSQQPSINLADGGGVGYQVLMQAVQVVPVAHAPRQKGKFLADFIRQRNIFGIAAHDPQRIDQPA